MKRIEVMTVATPAIDMDNNDQVIASLMVLKASQGWAVMIEVLNANLKYLENLILTKTDEITGAGVSEHQIEEARLKRSLTLDFLNTPEMIIKNLKMKDGVEEEYDPYYNLEDIANAKNRRGI